MRTMKLPLVVCEAKIEKYIVLFKVSSTDLYTRCSVIICAIQGSSVLCFETEKEDCKKLFYM